MLSLVWNEGSAPAAAFGSEHQKHLLKVMNILHSANQLGI